MQTIIIRLTKAGFVVNINFLANFDSVWNYLENLDLDGHKMGEKNSSKDLTKAVIVRIMDFIRKLDLVLRMILILRKSGNLNVQNNRRRNSESSGSK